MYTQNNEFILNALLECIKLNWYTLGLFSSDIYVWSTFYYNSMALLLQELDLVQYNFTDCVQL